MAINVDANQSIDSILQGLKLTAQAELVVINKTSSPLVRVGAHNENGRWPLGDIQPNTAEHIGNEYFSFAANYQVAEGKNFQFAASSPMVGRLKIDLGAINQPGNSATQRVWDNMSNRDDKYVANAPYSATARFLKIGTSLVWVFEVRPA